MSFSFIADIPFLFVEAITEKLSGAVVTLSPCDIQTSSDFLIPLKIFTFFLISKNAFPYSLEVDSLTSLLNFLHSSCIPKQIPRIGIFFENKISGKS